MKLQKVGISDKNTFEITQFVFLLHGSIFPFWKNDGDPLSRNTAF